MTSMNGIEEVDIKKIKPYSRNPRKNDDAVKAVAESLVEFGWKQPIVVDRDGVIIAGHTRWKAAKKLNMKSVPVIIADDLTEEQVKAYRLADNKVAEFSTWDFSLLDLELEEIPAIDMSRFGFELNAAAAPIVEDDYDIDVPEEPRTKIGDIYHLGEHILMCGDSTVDGDFAKLMGADKAHMVFTDPPWNVAYGESKHPSWKKRTIENDSMSTDDFKKFMESAFGTIIRYVEGGGMIYVVMSAQEWGNMMLTLDDAGIHWSSTIIWNKDALVLSRKDYHTKYEPIYYGWEGSRPRLCPLKDRKQCDVWDIQRPRKSDEHPTMKPIELVARAINNSSKPGDIVLDAFGGSGSTMIAAEQCGRKCRMMELTPGYCDVIVDRWEKFTGRKSELVRGTVG